MATPESVRIVGWGSCLPDRRLTNANLWEIGPIRDAFDVDRARSGLAEAVDPASLSPEEVFHHWAVQVTGIHERRILDPKSDQTTEDLCAEACKRALKQAGLAADDIDHIIVATLTASEIVPNAAVTVANRVGNGSISGYTLNAACAGFTYGLAAAFAALRAGLSRNALVVAGDAMSRVTDYDDPKTAILFGDGAGAVVVSSEASGGLEILGLPAIGNQYDPDPLWLVGQNWEREDDPQPKVGMKGGPTILKRAVASMMNVGAETLKSAGLGWDDVDVVIPHQANERITQALGRRLGLTSGRIVSNIAKMGNLSAATVAVALDETLRGQHGPVPMPGVTVLTAVGGGYTTAATVLRA